MDEIILSDFKKIKFEDLKFDYYINDQGVIINLNGKIPKIIKPFFDKHRGHYAVHLTFKNIMFESFVHEIPKNMVVIHINKNIKDNSLYNLKLVTKSETINYKGNQYDIEYDKIVKVCELLQAGHSLKEIDDLVKFNVKYNYDKIAKIRRRYNHVEISKDYIW